MLFPEIISQYKQLTCRNKLITILGVPVAAFAYYLCKYLIKAAHTVPATEPIVQREEDEFSPPITEVLFFTDKNALCSAHQGEAVSCIYEECSHSKLNKLISYLDSATDTLEICVLTITSRPLADVVLRKFRAGVKVRIITESSLSFGDGTQIPRFRKSGVRVRAKDTPYLMHHKFAIVDKRLLINGSYNWTGQATYGNWENIVITNRPKILVDSFVKHFEELWQQLD